MGYLPNLPPGRQPLTHPPPGRTANFEHSESNSIRGNVCAAVCMPVIVILATIRIYNKAYVKPGRTLDDYTFMLATVGALIYISLVIALLSKGFFGTHIWDLTVGDLRNSPFQLVLIIEVMWGPFVWLIKLSLFLMYLRLFEVLKWFKRLVWAGILCTGLFYISTSVAKIVLCAPRGGETYVIAFSKAQCGSTKQIGVVAGVFNIISDLYLLLIPMPAVWNLNTSKRNRLGILACFLTGIA